MKTRTKFVIGGAVILAVIVALSLQELQKMTVVQQGSVDWNAQAIQLSFKITEDGKKSIPVYYAGVKPDLFREGQGVVVEGKMNGPRFEASQLLVKHSEEYSVETEHKKSKEEYYKSILSQ